MKTLLRYYLINLGALWFTSIIIKGLVYVGGIQTLFLAALVFALINLILLPLLKILLLPLNLLTLGFFAWVSNVLALYFLTRIVPNLHLTSFYFPGFSTGGFSIPATEVTVFWTAVIASLAIGLLTNFFHWLSH